MKFKLTSLLLAAALVTPYTAFADTLPSDTTQLVYDLEIDSVDSTSSETATTSPAPTSELVPLDNIAVPTVSPEPIFPASDAITQAPSFVAPETDISQSADPALISDAIGVDIILAPHQAVIDSVARFNLFDSNGNLVGTDEQWVGGDTTQLRLQFTVPAYVIGDTFTLGLVDGLKELRYYDGVITPGGSFELTTYATTDYYGNLAHGNNFAMDGEPNFERAVNFYYDGNQISLWPRGRIVDGVSMVSAYDIGNAMKLPVEYHSDYNSLTISMGSNQLIFNLDTAYATFFGNDTYVSHYPFYMDNTIYVPLRDVLNAFGCTIDLWQNDDHIDVIAGNSPVIQEFRNKERVNREGIYSRTEYLIWVSKSDYQVKVYKGSQYNWECIRTAPCAIGAPDSPTIEGQFEYQYNGGMWSYPSYYVYPTMVFYGGYALHSTLRAWGGGLYDDSVGVQISHGCIRLHPTDIDWMYSIIPIGTKVYVTP